VTASTFKKTCVRLLISAMPLVVLLAMAATATNGQATGVKAQADANARKVSTGDSKLSANPSQAPDPTKTFTT